MLNLAFKGSVRSTVDATVHLTVQTQKLGLQSRPLRYGAISQTGWNEPTFYDKHYAYRFKYEVS